MLYATVMDAYASNVDFCTKYKQICINYPKSVYTRDVSMLKKSVYARMRVYYVCIMYVYTRVRVRRRLCKVP